MAQIFNSRDKTYKTKYGAAASGEEIIFRLLLPNQTGAVTHSARLFVENDRTKDREVCSLSPAAKGKNAAEWNPEKGSPKEGNSEEEKSGSLFWECTYRAKEPGLYWYFFTYETDMGPKMLCRGAYGNAREEEQTNGNGEDCNCSSPWQLTVYDAAAFQSSRWAGGVIYQIFPDRFFPSGTPKQNVPADRELLPWGSLPKWQPNGNGEVVNQDYQGGDLNGIREKIPYLKGLGVTVLYLNPIFEAHSNHRYNTADYEKIDPLLGTEKDFSALCEEAHKAGIKIILDGVFSHTGDDSVYFNKKNRYPSSGAYNSKSSPYFSWYRFTVWPDAYESWWDFPTLPNVTEEEPSYTEFITGENGILAKWLRLGADGWRLDVADELPDSFIRNIRLRVKKTKPEALLLGEVWEDASNKVAYEQRRSYLFGQELDSVMNYPFAEAILAFLRFGQAETFLEKILTITENYPKPVTDVLMNLLGTHDTARILTRLVGESVEGKDRAWQASQVLPVDRLDLGIRLEKMAAALQFTLPGIPSLYYGDEVGMQGYKDPFNRGAFPWDNPNKDLRDWYTRLGALRKVCPVLKEGQFVPISGASGCVAYARINETHPDLTDQGDALVVIANNNPEAISYRLPKEAENTIPLQNGTEKTGRMVRIPPYACAFLGRGPWVEESLSTIFNKISDRENSAS